MPKQKTLPLLPIHPMYIQKKTSTEEMFKYDSSLSLNKKIESIIDSFLEGYYKLSPSSKSLFIRAYAHALYDLAIESDESVYSFYKKLQNVKYFSPKYDNPENAPTDKDKKNYQKLVDKTEKYLLSKIPEKFGVIQIFHQTDLPPYREVYKITKNGYFYTLVGHGSKFSKTKAVLGLLISYSDMVFVKKH